MRRLLVALFLLAARPAWATLPTYVTSSGFTAGIGTCTPNVVSMSKQADDILILVANSENEAISLSTPAGFVEVTNSPQSAGTAATDPASRLAVYWKRATGSDTNPTVADSGNNTGCVVFGIRGAKKTGNPWNVTAGGNDGGSNDTTAVIPGATTTVADTLVLLIESTSFNGTSTTECGAVTNADLANLTERGDNSNTAGLGGGSCMITGEKAASGSYANSTLTMANTTFKGAMSIAIEPEPPPTCTAGLNMTLLGVGGCP